MSSVNARNGSLPSVFRSHLALARISNTPTVISNVLAGVVLAHPLGLDWLTVGICVAIVFFYTAGMYLNDVLDLEIDRTQRPDRPIPSDAVPLKLAWGITIALFVIGLLLLIPAGTTALIAGVALIACIAVYDFWHKGNPIGPLFMGGTRVSVYVTAFLAFSRSWTWEATLWCAIMLLYVAGLTSISKTEHGPSATRYWPLASLFLPVILAVSRSQEPIVLILIVAFVLWVVYCCSFVYVASRRSIGGAIARLIAGISLVDALLLATHEAWWGVATALAAFVSTVVLQRWIRGT